MKITFFQKQMGSKFSQDTFQKLAKERSDFLLLPQRVLLNPSKDPSNSSSQYENILDQTLDLSIHYKGVLLGGTLFRNQSNKLYESVPIVQDMSLIDHYDLKSSSVSKATLGDSETAFIMAGVRFSILAGNDIYNDEYLDEISGKGINIIFFLDSEPSKRTYEEDLDFFSELSKKRNWNIFRVCGYDENSSIPGRSLVSTPTGIQWKVGKSEEYKDILKTIHFAQANPFL